MTDIISSHLEHPLSSPTCLCDIDPALRSVPRGPLTVPDAQRLFASGTGYVDTAAYGLKSFPVLAAMFEAQQRSLYGSVSPVQYHEAVTEARRLFARIIGVPEEWVSVGATTAGFVTMIANAVPRGSTVLVAEDEFSSACGPFGVQEEQGHYQVKTVPLKELADAVKADVSLVVVSPAQSLDGSVADLDAITAAAKKHGAWTLVDATQSAGWWPLDNASYTFLVCHAYKWLTAPRGATFMVVQPEMLPLVPAIGANWYGGKNIWDSLYGMPQNLAQDARRYDQSPAWDSWVGAVPALQLIDSVGVDAINRHDLRLASLFRDGMGMEAVPSPIVSVRVPDAAERLAQVGLKASVRGGAARLSFHLYNTDSDVERALAALRA